jgi:hypothetical protein
MELWKVRALIAAMALLSLVPLAIALPLWPYLRRQSLSGARRWLSFAGLGLATVGSLGPPVWVVALVLQAHLGESSDLANGMVEAALAALGTAVAACPLLCFAKGRVRWAGLLVCALSLLLVAMSLGLSYGMGRWGSRR